MARSQQTQFIRFPWDLYAGDKNWVPPLIMDLKELLNYKKHPFYDNAEIQTFLAYRDGKICGRIAAIVDHAHNKTHQRATRDVWLFRVRSRLRRRPCTF